jgi:hypothetical protein
MGQILSILWEILSILWEICYLIGIFRNHSSPRSQLFLESFSGKFFLKTRAESKKVGQISFRPPIFFLPVVRQCPHVYIVICGKKLRFIIYQPSINKTRNISKSAQSLSTLVE